MYKMFKFTLHSLDKSYHNSLLLCLGDIILIHLVRWLCYMWVIPYPNIYGLIALDLVYDILVVLGSSSFLRDCTMSGLYSWFFRFNLKLRDSLRSALMYVDVKLIVTTIWFSTWFKVSSHVTDFNTRNKLLTAKLLNQGYRYHKLRLRLF